MLLVATFGVLLTLPFLLRPRGPAAAVVGVLVLAFVAGLGIETFGCSGTRRCSRRSRQDRLSRVYSYDALGSWALIPLGLALAGPLAEAIGTRATLIGRGLLSLGATLLVLFVPAVRDLRRREPIELREPVLESVA